MDNEEYYVTTQSNTKEYTFRVKKYIKTYNNTYINDCLRVAGDSFCVELLWDKDTILEKGVELLWLDIGIKMDNEICDGIELNRDDAILLLQTAIQVLKTYTTSYASFIHFLDYSTFICTLNGEKVKARLIYYYFMTHKGKTWYQDVFGAYPDPTAPYYYRDYSTFFDDPKPESFHPRLHTKELNYTYSNLYLNTNTWNEFLHVIGKNYEVILPWVQYAYYQIAHSTIQEFWRINIKDFPLIQYTRKDNDGDTFVFDYTYQNHTNLFSGYGIIQG